MRSFTLSGANNRSPIIATGIAKIYFLFQKIIKIKNPMLILYAMNDIVNQYPNIHLNIAGDGPEKKKMLKYVN